MIFAIAATWPASGFRHLSERTHRPGLCPRPRSDHPRTDPGRGASGYLAGFGLGKISAGTAQFRDFIRNALADIAPADIDNVYISRTRFGGKGGIINEQRLERLLEAEGYTAVERSCCASSSRSSRAPGTFSDLMARPFMCWLAAANSDQHAGIIIRRSNPAYHHIAEHLHGFTGRPPEIINHLAADWMPHRQKLANHVKPGASSTLTVWGRRWPALASLPMRGSGAMPMRRKWPRASSGPRPGPRAAGPAPRRVLRGPVRPACGAGG